MEGKKKMERCFEAIDSNIGLIVYWIVICCNVRGVKLGYFVLRNILCLHCVTFRLRLEAGQWSLTRLETRARSIIDPSSLGLKFQYGDFNMALSWNKLHLSGLFVFDYSKSCCSCIDQSVTYKTTNTTNRVENRILGRTVWINLIRIDNCCLVFDSVVSISRKVARRLYTWIKIA